MTKISELHRRWSKDTDEKDARFSPVVVRQVDSLLAPSLFELRRASIVATEDSLRLHPWAKNGLPAGRSLQPGRNRIRSGLARIAVCAMMGPETGMLRNISVDSQVLSAFCQRHHIKRLALFGSVLRDDFRPDSDIDVLVEFLPGHVPGLQFMAIERELSGLLQGRRVDLVTPKFLAPRIRERVLIAAEPLYVAA